MKKNVKQYWSLVWILLLILVLWYVWYRSIIAYWWEHLYYNEIINSFQNRWIVLAALWCVCVCPFLYFIMSSKVNLKKLVVWLWIWAWIFWWLHSIIKLAWTWTSVMWFWSIIIIFHTLLLFFLQNYSFFKIVQ